MYINCIFCVDDKLYIGLITRQTLSKQLNEGSISPEDVNKFHRGVPAFIEEASAYVLKRLPVDNPLLKHASNSWLVSTWKNWEEESPGDMQLKKEVREAEKMAVRSIGVLVAVSADIMNGTLEAQMELQRERRW